MSSEDTQRLGEQDTWLLMVQAFHGHTGELGFKGFDLGCEFTKFTFRKDNFAFSAETRLEVSRNGFWETRLLQCWRGFEPMQTIYQSPWASAERLKAAGNVEEGPPLGSTVHEESRVGDIPHGVGGERERCGCCECCHRSDRKSEIGQVIEIIRLTRKQKSFLGQPR